MLRDEDLIILEDEFDNYAEECRAAMNIAMARIENVSYAIKRTECRSPFDMIESRLKTFESTLEKCEDKGIELTIDSIKEHIKDVAGIRVITIFRDDIYRVTEILERIPGINVVRKKDYVSKPKPNGYSSMHLNVQIEIYLPNVGSKLIPVEIQVRDKAMDLWATVEHIVGYKNENPSPEVGGLFKSVSDILNEFDERAMKLRDS